RRLSPVARIGEVRHLPHPLSTNALVGCLLTLPKIQQRLDWRADKVQPRSRWLAGGDWQMKAAPVASAAVGAMVAAIVMAQCGLEDRQEPLEGSRDEPLGGKSCACVGRGARYRCRDGAPNGSG